MLFRNLRVSLNNVQTEYFFEIKLNILKITQNTSYSNVNKVTSIDLPEAAKNANEIGRN